VHPDQNRMRRALERDDLFIVGIEVALTDSMQYADVLLPACTHFEQSDIHTAYGQQYLQRSAPVIAPVGESLPNTEIFRRLAARFGYDGPAFTASDADLMDVALDRHDARMRGVRASQLPLDRALSMEYDGAEPVLFRNVWPTTPSGKIELHSSVLATRYGAALPTFRPVHSPYPLTLISPASEKRITSTFGGLTVNDSTPMLEMHPSDAAGRKLVDGQWVKVWNDLGEVYLRPQCARGWCAQKKARGCAPAPTIRPSRRSHPTTRQTSPRVPASMTRAWKSPRIASPPPSRP
jgi:anaerobic selenocysteine-containing dehydrogenase